VAAVSVGVIDLAEDVTAFELVDPDPMAGRRLLARAAAAPGCGPRARAELADIARRQPAVSDLADRLLAGRIGPVWHHRGGVPLGALARLAHHPVRRTALHDVHLAAGARLDDHGEWLDVVDYGDPRAERRAVERAAGLWDSGRSGLWELQGRDAAALLAALAGIDAPPPGRLSVGDVSPAHEVPYASPGATRSPGRSRSPRLLVAATAPGRWQVRAEPLDVDIVEARLATLVHLEARHLQAFTTSIAEDRAGLLVVGPRAGDVIRAALGVLPPEGTVSTVEHPSLGAVQLWSFVQGGRPAVELRVAAGAATDAWAVLLASGRAFGLRPVGAGTVAADVTGGGDS
jgi:hypothetical protein